MKKIIYIFLASIFLFACKQDDDSTPSVNNTPPSTNDSFSGETEWIKTYGGSKNELAKSVIATQDGGYAVLGYTQSNDGDITDKPLEGFDYWVMKFNADDTLQWNKTYGGTLDDRGNKIIQTQDGGYAIVGYSQSNDEDASNNAGSYDFWVVKLNAAGNISWEKSIGYSGSDKAFSIIQTTDNGYFLTGVLDVTASGGAGNSSKAAQHAGGDYWAIKLDANGNTQWTKYFGGNLSDTPYDAIQTTDGGFIIVGSSDSTDVDISGNKGVYDFWIIKIDAAGILVWEKSFGGTEIDEAHAIVNSGDGNYLIVGDTRSSDSNVSQNNGAADLWLIKISPTGDLIWEKTYGGSSFDVGRTIVKTLDNGFLIAGSSRSIDGVVTQNQGQNDAWILKINSNAVLQWQKTIGGTGVDFAYSVTQLSSQKVILVGESSSNDIDIPENKGFTDLLIAKIK